MSVLVEREAVAKKQDLSKEFVNAKAFQFPFMSSVPKGAKPNNALLEYAVEKYADPVTTGAVDEADPTSFVSGNEGDAVLNARVHTLELAVRIGGHATTFTEQSGITPRNVIAKKIAKKLMELKRNAEVVCLGDSESQVDNGVVGNQTRGLVKWAQSTAQSHYPVDSNYRTPATSIDASTALADYTDDTITAVAQSQYDETGDDGCDNIIFAGSRWKRNMSRISFYSRNVTNMTSVRQFQQSVKDTVVMGKVDFLETDFSNFQIRLSQHINASGDPTSAASKRLAVGGPLDYLSLRFAEQPYSQPLAKTGRNEKFMVTTTFALACTNPRTLVKWAPGS